MSTKRPADSAALSASVLSGWPLRRKLALALAIPLLLAGTLGGLRVQSDLREASNSASSAQQVTALRPAVDYLTAAEQAMVAALGTDQRSQAALEEALVDIRAAGRELLESKESADLTEDQRYQVDAVLDLSQALRAEDANTLSPGTWVAQLRQLQSGVTQLISTVVNEQINPEPRLELLSQTLAGRFSLAMQQALVATERTGETGSLELFAELGVEGAAIDRLASALGASEKEVASLRTANAQRFRTVRTGGTDLGGDAAYADYDSIISTLQDGIDAELEAAAAEARAGAAANALITLAALAAAVLLALLVARLLLNPIQRVREGALAVAHEQLPQEVARIRSGEDPGEIEPIDVHTEEEIGQLARAVDDMHRQAVVLASGEANLRSQVSQMFVTLSRRNTSLVNQQLGLIERLERDEEDPKRLESLFRLDHLAARMRRTADSLLILADAPTATAVVDGLTVSDALQAATAGVQDYQRVRIRSTNPVRISDTAAADVVHVLTELVDNALTYSPPTSSVTVGSTTTDHGVVIEVADAGLGIPAEELAKINESLGSGGEVTLDTARRMGLFVVGRLSQRHGLSTSLRANDEGGTTVTVLLPAKILPELAPAPVPEPQEQGSLEPAMTDPAATDPTATDPTATDAAATDPAPTAPTLEPAPKGQTSKVAKLRNRDKADRKPRMPHREPVAEATTAQTPVMTVEDRIDFALGLPKRNPGANGPAAGAPKPVTPETAAAALKALQPVTEPIPIALAAPEPAAEVEPEPAADPKAEPAAEAQEPKVNGAEGQPTPDAKSQSTAKAEPTADEKSEPTAEPEPEVKAAKGKPTPDAKSQPTAKAEPTVDMKSEPTAEPEPEVKAATVNGSRSTAAPKQAAGALDGDWTDPGPDGFDTPIFRSLRSAWLSSDDEAQPWRTSEIEAGWEMAEQLAEKPAGPELSKSGLPMRRPGSRLVPGGVTTTPTVTSRDPEVIRARLAAHASGVSKGRKAAKTKPDPRKTEAGS